MAETDGPTSRSGKQLATRGLVWLSVVGVVAVVLTAIMQGGGDPPPIRDDTATPSDKVAKYTPPSGERYVGSQACAECHEEVFATYTQHPMYCSTRRVEDDPTPPPSSVVAVTDGARRMTAVADGPAVVHHEQMRDKDENLIYDLSFPMQFVVGSGRRAKSYLHQRGRVMCRSPLNWFTSTQTWDVNPGVDPNDPRRFDRRTGTQCLGCHAGRLAMETRMTDDFRSDPFHEIAIGCERCHGPGGDHIDWHEQSLRGTDPIVNPAKLSPVERDSVCFQCHLPTSGRLLRTGRAHTDFRPGQRIDDVWTVTEATTSTVDADGKARRIATVQVQQMRESLCYQESGTRLTCISCHDPHRLPAESERVTFYRDRCAQCHKTDDCAAPGSDRQAVGDSCISCHMPRREMTRTRHASQTDHRILRRPDQIRDTPPVPPWAVQFFDNLDENVPAIERRRAVAMSIFSRGEPYPPQLSDEVDELLGTFPTDGPLLLIRAALARVAGDVPTALEFLERALDTPDGRSPALEDLTELCYESADYENALKWSDRFLELNAYSPLVHAIRADAYLQTGHPDKAIEAAIECLKLKPDVVKVRTFLRDLYGTLGRANEQQQQTKLLDRIGTATAPSK